MMMMVVDVDGSGVMVVDTASDYIKCPPHTNSSNMENQFMSSIFLNIFFPSQLSFLCCVVANAINKTCDMSSLWSVCCVSERKKYYENGTERHSNDEA